MRNDENTVYMNIGVSESTNWKLKELAAKKKVTKQDLVILLIQEATK
jgi:hypothetical protein